MNRWLGFADKACERLPHLITIEDEFDLFVDFKISPKIQAIFDTLDLQRAASAPTGKRLSGSKEKQLRLDNDGKRETILIVVKNHKQANDLQRILMTHYTRKDQNRAYHEQKLFYHLASHQEHGRRECILHRRSQSNN